MNLKDRMKFQNWKLYKMLRKDQFQALLAFIYKEQSEIEAKADWENILKLKINTPGKEEAEYKKIADFHLNKNIFLDKKADRYERKVRDLMGYKATLLEPHLLTRANILSNGRYANNRYASVVLYEKELKLSPGQTDSLLIKYQAYERIKIRNSENAMKNSLDPVLPLPNEYQQIARIINNSQLNQWLLLRYKNESITKARESWTRLEKEGLAKGLDKEKTTNDLATYHLQLLVAIEKVKNNRSSPENPFLIRDVEKNKPEVLQQYDEIIRNRQKAISDKKDLKW